MAPRKLRPRLSRVACFLRGRWQFPLSRRGER